MADKRMEGNEDQQRERAREALAQGKRASEMEGTTGASKQPNRQADEKGKPGGNRGRAEHD